MADKTYNVLLIDDDKFLLQMYAMKFTKAGAHVEVVTSGQEALDRLKDDTRPHIDIVVLDIIMPGMDGLESLHNIRKENLATDAKVIMLSNQNSPQDIEKAKNLKIDGYIVKATMIPSEVVDEVYKIAQK